MTDSGNTERIAQALAKFARGNSTIAALQAALAGVVAFHPASVELRQPLPIVPLEAADVITQLHFFLRGERSAAQVSSWARVLILLGCFGLDLPDTEDTQPAVVTDITWELAFRTKGELTPERAYALLERLKSGAA